MARQIGEPARTRRLTTTPAIAVLVIAGLALACSSTESSGPAEATVSICHLSGTSAIPMVVAQSALAAHKSHGDYVTALDVNKTNTAGDSIHFTRITDALAVARAGRIARNELETAACRITISVASQTVPGSTSASTDPSAELFPIVIDVPDITLSGALDMQLDAANRATGAGINSDATTFTPSPRLVVRGGADSQTGVSEEIIVMNGHIGGSKGNGAEVKGFVFQNGHIGSDSTFGGQGILSMRVTNVWIHGNRFEGGFTESIDLRASSGLVERNYLSGGGAACDICVAGPGTYTVRDNRLMSGGIPGILAATTTLLPVPLAVEQFTYGPTSQITAYILNNEVRDHLRKPVGVGIRVAAIGIGAPNVAGSATVSIVGNNLVRNNFGIIIEGAFPVAGTLLRGDVNVSTSGNTISQSCQNDVLVSLSRHTTALGLSNLPYLRNSTFNLEFGSDVSWDSAWYGNPPGFGNTLIVNDVPVANGIRAAYDASRVCP